MDRRLTGRDKLLLATTLPLMAAVLAAHVHETERTGLAQLPVFARWVPGGYPTVATYRLETDSSGSGLEPGDRLIRIGDRDLRGVGYVGFDAIGLARTTPGHPVPLVFERDGVRHTVPLESRPHPQRWSRVPILLFVPIVCVLLLLRAPGQPDAQRFYLCFMTYAIGQAQFYGGPEWQTWIAAIVWNVASTLMLFFMLRFARLFPPEMPDSRRLPWILPWAAVALFVVFVRLNYFIGWPLPLDWVPRVSFATHGGMSVIGIAILSWNYAQAWPAGRRRLRWILLGVVLGSLPVVAAGLAPMLFPGWEGFRSAFQVGFLSSTIWMLGAVLGTVRDNAFDVDRLIGATAAWSLAAAGAVGGLAIAVPALSSALSDSLGVDPTTTRLALAAVLGALVIPVGAGLRPRVDRLLFPDRVALAEGAARLADELSSREDPDDLAEHAAARIAALFDARGVALYRREAGGLVLRSAHGLSPPPVLPPTTALPTGVRLRDVPPPLGPDVAVVVPVSAGAQIDALVLLGPKHSGDIYTTNDAAILTTIAARLETELLHFQKRVADRESRAKTNLLAAASHDLRQPLHTVSILAEALQGKLDDPEVRALVGHIGDATHDLDEMLTSLLDRSQLDAGGVRPRVGDVALNDVFAQLDRDLAPQAAERGLRLRIVPTRLVARTDPLLLMRILRNLIGNALRYAGRDASVLVGARPRGRFVAIEVRDSGPGIPVDSQSEIFEAFRQLSRGREGGLGLGLSIVDGLARVLGHDVTLRSAPGRGSTFAVTLQRSSAAPSATAASADDEARAGRATLARRVLLVEDDAGVRRATDVLLEGWGCDARSVPDVDAALAALEDGWRPDFALVDYHLPDGANGLDALAALRARVGPELRAAILTSETSPELLARMKAGGLPVLRKPVRPARLRAVLSAVGANSPMPEPS